MIPALGVALVAAAFHPNLHGAWPFLLAGLLAPGGSQILFTLAVREAGAARTSVMVGAAPLVAVAIALVFLDEPLRLPLLVGAVGDRRRRRAARRRARPARAHPPRSGCSTPRRAAVLFATRDNLARGAAHAHDARARRRRRR